jgi:hypothetical protein
MCDCRRRRAGGSADVAPSAPAQGGDELGVGVGIGRQAELLLHGLHRGAGLGAERAVHPADIVAERLESWMDGD